MNILKYIIYRFIALIAQIIGAIALIFTAMSLVPYDPVAIFIFNLNDNTKDTNALINQLKNSMGLDQPLYARFWNYIVNLFSHFSLGNSWTENKPVTDMYATALGTTFKIFGLGFILYTILAAFMGVMAASRVNSRLDRNMRLYTSLFYSVPPYVLGALLIYFSGQYITPMIAEKETSDFIISRILPILTVILIYTGFQFRLIRIYMLNVFNKNYIRTAVAKGLDDRTILIHHAFKNALPEIITSIAITFPVAFSGIAVLEKVFNIAGSGLLIINYSLLFDWPVVIGGAVIFTALNASILAITDMLIHYIDPRLRLEKNIN